MSNSAVFFVVASAALEAGANYLLIVVDMRYEVNK
jgi:hypothetical protein